MERKGRGTASQAATATRMSRVIGGVVLELACKPRVRSCWATGSRRRSVLAILRTASSRTNLKLHLLGHRLVHEMAEEAAQIPCRSRIEELLERVTASDYVEE